MKGLLVFILMMFTQLAYSQVILDANGPGETYELITSVLAPNHNPIEVPDCNHEEFGKHIDEIFDEELNIHVFRFHIHTTPDNDRCINFDRQRNEIKSYDQSPDNLLGVENEKVIYKWKFKLTEGFQSSPNFTHLHQLKSVGGSLASMPMYTLTTRKASPDRLELRYAETDDQITLAKTDLAPLIGKWLEVTETIKYGTNGTYEIIIKSVIDDQTLFSYANNAIINWRPGADFVRPKWGIYRSLINDQDLRDETVLFANFSIEELAISSTGQLHEQASKIIISNPASNTLFISSASNKINSIQLFNLNGQKLLEKHSAPKLHMTLDVSAIPSGTYITKVNGEKFTVSKLVFVAPL